MHLLLDLYNTKIVMMVQFDDTFIHHMALFVKMKIIPGNWVLSINITDKSIKSFYIICKFALLNITS